MPDEFPQRGDNYAPVSPAKRGVARRIAKIALRRAEEAGDTKEAERCRAILRGLENDQEVF